MEAASLGKKLHLNSGRFGCGVFGNDDKAVFLLHQLLAKQTGTSVSMYGYREMRQKECHEEWIKLANFMERQPNATVTDWIAAISKYSPKSSYPIN